VTDKTEHCTAASPAGCAAGGDLLSDDEDFDELLAASSFGSEQARRIREQTSAAASEHARRILDGEEKRPPAEGDIDDAVGGLVYGLAHGVVPGHNVITLAGCALAHVDLVAAWSGRKQTNPALIIIIACQTSALWPDDRAHLLQALIDHNAFADLRSDVAWNIVDWAFDVPRPPRVLRQCVSLAVKQIDVSALASTWLSFAQSMAVDHSCSAYSCRREASERPGGSGPEPEKIALMPAPDRPALPAGSAAPVTAGQVITATSAQRGPDRRPARRRPPQHALKPARRPPQSGPRTGSRRKSSILAGMVAVIIAGIAAVILGAAGSRMGGGVKPMSLQTTAPRSAASGSRPAEKAPGATAWSHAAAAAAEVPRSMASHADVEITFKPGTAAFADPGPARLSLSEIASQLLADPSRIVTLEAFIIGGTSIIDQGKLSQQRTDYVRTELTERGVSPTQITLDDMPDVFSGNTPTVITLLLDDADSGR